MIHTNKFSQFSSVFGLLCAVALLAAAASSVNAAPCTPIYPECVCKTPDTFNCSSFNMLYKQISTHYVELQKQSMRDAGDFIGGAVRLAFHDAAEYVVGENTWRSDGCIKVSDSDNRGLQRAIAFLDELWRPVCDQINRADFWFLAAKIALETATPYIDGPNSYSGPGLLPNFNIPFYVGREDSPNCYYNDTGRLPSAKKGGLEIKRVLMNALGLTSREAAALMGGHAVGGLTPEDTGFLGAWSVRSDLFTTNYYKLLQYATFLKKLRQNPNDRSTVTQWNVTANLAFLTPDLGLLYDMQARHLPQSCGPFDSPTNSCPSLGSKHPDLADFAIFVSDFADGSAGMDQPGSAKFLSEFARAFNKMSHVGYEKGELSCLQCASPNCIACTPEEMCEGPQYGYYQKRR